MNDKNSSQFRLVVGDWPLCEKDASSIRHEVFVLEQKVPPELELDEHDARCIHAVVYDGEHPAATGRLLPDGHIGRLAVRQVYRGQGLGSMILSSLVDEARRNGHLQVELAAQLHAQGFYAAHGFVAEGDVFLDAGIDHVMMRRMLTV
ncbi:MAG TPA: GNAT family N-acetyltransferase [Burkholderiaceae bacterium]|nr:GNAT family N-acetyltransferase [Burkholderiaceae bacterium]